VRFREGGATVTQAEALDYLLVAGILALPFILAMFGWTAPVDHIYGYMQENLTGVTVTLAS